LDTSTFSKKIICQKGWSSFEENKKFISPRDIP